jgi:hypothetical protein
LSSPLPAVRFWELWNEPNFGQDLAPQATRGSSVSTAPHMYRALVDAGWSALERAGHGHDTFLTPPKPASMPKPKDPGRKPVLHGIPDRLFWVLFSDLPHLAATLDRLQRIYGATRRSPIYNTEFGYITRPPNSSAHYGSHFVSPTPAATYMNWAEYDSWRQSAHCNHDAVPAVRPVAQLSGFATGLIFHDGKLKSTFDAYRMPLYLPVPSIRHGHGIEVWGCVRPAHYASSATNGASQRVHIQFRRGGHRPFRTIETVTITNVRGYFDLRVAFPATGSVRLAWTYPSGSTIFSRIATVTRNDPVKVKPTRAPKPRSRGFGSAV